MNIKRILYIPFVIAILAFTIYFVVFTLITTSKIIIDFPIFYGSARNAIYGMSIYTYYGFAHLPFWYFPWTSWIFIPLAFFSSQVAWIIYIVICFGIAFLSINALAKYYQQFNLFDRLFMFSLFLWITWLAYRVGQITYVILGAIVLVMLSIVKGRYILAGLLIPILLIKPHLFIIFIPLVLWLGGKKLFLSGTIITIFLMGVETIIDFHWPGKMLTLLSAGTTRVDVGPWWNFSTFQTILGLSQNYVGTADLPLTIILIIVAAFVVFRFRSLPKIPLMSLALTASLFCAPRAYAYDMVLLIPALIWLSEKWSYKSVLLWMICAVMVVLAHYSAYSYLVTLLVFSLGIYKAYSIERQEGVSRSFFGRDLNSAKLRELR